MIDLEICTPEPLIQLIDRQSTLRSSQSDLSQVVDWSINWFCQFKWCLDGLVYACLYTYLVLIFLLLQNLGLKLKFAGYVAKNNHAWNWLIDWLID